MKQIYHPYWNWECFKNGMWNKRPKEYEEIELPKIIEFTGDHIKYGSAMMEAVKNWPVSCENFLSNASMNRRAYIGHAGCCILNGWPEYLVRQAWGKLTDMQRFLANKEADKAIRSWELKQRLNNTLAIGEKNAMPAAYQMKLILG